MIEVGQHGGDRELRTLVHWEPLRSGDPCEVGNLAKWEILRGGNPCVLGNLARWETLRFAAIKSPGSRGFCRDSGTVSEYLGQPLCDFRGVVTKAHDSIGPVSHGIFHHHHKRIVPSRLAHLL